MKFFILFTLFSLTFTCASAQNRDAVNLPYVNIPLAETNTGADIANYINKHFDSDSKKVAAIYKWIITNVTYDADSIHYVILDEDNEERVSFALRRKKGVCENFAAIFNDLCSKCGILSFTIDGFTKESGIVNRSGHSWCAAFVDGQWNLYDPTWDAGYAQNGSFVNEVHDNYFKVKPAEFIQTHLPFDPLFQFLNYPLSYKEFVAGSFNDRNSKGFFNYKDSIDSYKKKDRLSQYLSAISRIKSEGWPASKVDIKLKRLQQEVEIIRQDSDMSFYDSAVADYNNAINLLNSFVIYRNNQFQPSKTNEEVEKNFKHISELLTSSSSKLKQVNGSKAVLVLDTGDLQKKLHDLDSKLKDQEAFYKNNSVTSQNH